MSFWKIWSSSLEIACPSMISFLDFLRIFCFEFWGFGVLGFLGFWGFGIAECVIVMFAYLEIACPSLISFLDPQDIFVG